MATANPTPSSPPAQGPHGHPNPLYRGYYKKGCRCADCVTANKEMCKQRYRRHEANDPERRKAKWRKHIQTPGMIEAHRARGRERAKLDSEKQRCRTKATARRADRKPWLNQIRMERGCCDCGFRGHHAALDFDHVSGEKHTAVMRMSCHSIEQIRAEVAKCDVVCSNCHRIRTKRRDPNGDKRIGTRRLVELNKMQTRSRRVGGENAAILSRIKTECGCMDCGYHAHPESLDFDHVRGVKSFNMAQVGTRKMSSILEEIAKCDVVCANCHRVRTYNRLLAII